MRHCIWLFVLGACASSGPELTSYEQARVDRCKAGDALECSGLTAPPRAERLRSITAWAVERTCDLDADSVCASTLDAAYFVADPDLYRRVRPKACAAPTWISREDCELLFDDAIVLSRYAAAERAYAEGQRDKAIAEMATLCAEAHVEACRWQRQLAGNEAAARDRALAQAEEHARAQENAKVSVAQSQDRERRHEEARKTCYAGDGLGCARLGFFERGNDPDLDKAEFDKFLARLKSIQ